MSDHTPLRRCSKCLVEYPATKNYFRWSTRDGLGQPCRECLKAEGRAYVARYPERKRARRQRYQANHPDKVKADKLNWQRNNPDKRRIINSRSSRQCRTNRQLNVVRYRTRKAGYLNTFTNDDWQRALDYFNNCCAVCGRPRGLWHTLSADHWIPLTSPDCPGTIPTNILPLCHGIDGCNNSKSNHDPYEWLLEKYGKRKAFQTLKRIQAYFAQLKDK